MKNSQYLLCSDPGSDQGEKVRNDPVLMTAVGPEKLCSSRKIIVVESFNDRKFDNLARFGEPHPAPVRRILV